MNKQKLRQMSKLTQSCSSTDTVEFLQYFLLSVIKYEHTNKNKNLKSTLQSIQVIIYPNSEKK